MYKRNAIYKIKGFPARKNGHIKRLTQVICRGRFAPKKKAKGSMKTIAMVAENRIVKIRSPIRIFEHYT